MKSSTMYPQRNLLTNHDELLIEEITRAYLQSVQKTEVELQKTILCRFSLWWFMNPQNSVTAKIGARI